MKWLYKNRPATKHSFPREGNCKMFDILKKLNQNPIYIKECLLRGKKKNRQRPELVSILLWMLYPIGFVISISTLYRDSTINLPSSKIHFYSLPYFIVLLIDICFCFKAMSHSWNTLSYEREMKTYDNLISTFLSPGEIITGKFLSVFLPIAGEILTFIPLIILLVLYHGIPFELIILIVSFILIHSAFFIILGIYVSSRLKSTAESKEKGNRVLINFMAGTIIFAVILSMVTGNGTVFPFNFYKLDESFLKFFPSFTILTISPIANISAIFKTGTFLDMQEVGNFRVCMIYLAISALFYLIVGKILVRKIFVELTVSKE